MHQHKSQLKADAIYSPFIPDSNSNGTFSNNAIFMKEDICEMNETRNNKKKLQKSKLIKDVVRLNDPLENKERVLRAS